MSCAGPMRAAGGWVTSTQVRLFPRMAPDAAGGVLVIPSQADSHSFREIPAC